MPVHARTTQNRQESKGADQKSSDGHSESSGSGDGTKIVRGIKVKSGASPIPGCIYEFGHPCCMDEYPHHSEIPARCFEPLDNEKEFRNAFPYNTLRKRQKVTHSILTKAIEQAESELERDIERYEDIRKRGDEAMSDYDLRFGYTAQSSGLPLKYAHIGYARGKLRILKHWMEKLYRGAAAIPQGKQGSLF